MFYKFKLIFHTIRYLKFRQIFNRIKRRYLKLAVKVTPAPNVSLISRNPKSFIMCQIKMISKNRFKFLNVIGDIKKAEDWNHINQDKLWLYNLHYFDDLNAFKSSQRSKWHSNLIDRWINENPLGYGNGWEPYPSSLRIINWIKWSLNGNLLKQEWLDSLAIQVRNLSNNLETHILGNHLFVNAKALVFAGLFFRGKEADTWYQIGFNLIEKELPEQVLDDGGNFELSPMYHSIFLEDLLDLVNIHHTYNKGLLRGVEDKIQIMIVWLEVMHHPDGNLSFFNDTAFNIAPSLEELIKYSKRLNLKKVSKQSKQFIYLKDSGYIRIQRENLVAIIDIANVGPEYIPGHAHADTLSFELSLFGKRLIVNSGISTYESNSERHKQRSTLSHSTIVIDDQNSSEVWSSFRVARRARVLNIKTKYNDNKINVSASHDGYKKLKGKPIHNRDWSFLDNKVEIIDSISGKGFHSIESRLPIHPEASIINIFQNSIEILVNNKVVQIIFDGLGKLEVVSSKYHLEFGLSVDNKILVYKYNASLPIKFTTKILWKD